MNWFKDKLAGQAPLHGIWLASGAHAAAELAATAGFDWALLDLEHGLATEADALRALQVLTPSPVATVARVPTWDSPLVPRLLDCGASGIMAPMIRTAAEAAEFVRALRYPPQGKRGLSASSRAAGYGATFRSYFAEANERVAGIVQIETVEALGCLDALAALDGVDMLFIGHSDLSLALGCYERFDAPEFVAAEQAVIAACARHGKHAGMLLKSGMPIADYRRRGYRGFALGTDLGCLRGAYAQLLRSAQA